MQLGRPEDQFRCNAEDDPTDVADCELRQKDGETAANHDLRKKAMEMSVVETVANQLPAVETIANQLPAMETVVNHKNINCLFHSPLAHKGNGTPSPLADNQQSIFPGSNVGNNPTVSVAPFINPSEFWRKLKNGFIKFNLIKEAVLEILRVPAAARGSEIK